MKLYAIYDLKNDEQCVAVFDTVKEVAEYFGKTKNCIFATITLR